MNFLSMLGLVTAEAHAKLDDLFATVARERNQALIEAADATEKFKKAVKDVEKQAVEIERLTRGWDKANANNSLLRRQLDDSEAELALTRHDAEKLRSKRANDAALKREKRAAAKVQLLAA